MFEKSAHWNLILINSGVRRTRRQKLRIDNTPTHRHTNFILFCFFLQLERMLLLKLIKVGFDENDRRNRTKTRNNVFNQKGKQSNCNQERKTIKTGNLEIAEILFFFLLTESGHIFSVFGCRVANESNKTSGKSSEMLRDDDSCYNLVVTSFTC